MLSLRKKRSSSSPPSSFLQSMSTSKFSSAASSTSSVSASSRSSPPTPPATPKLPKSRSPFFRLTVSASTVLRLRVHIDNPRSRAAPFHVEIAAGASVAQLKAEVIRVERMRGRGDVLDEMVRGRGEDIDLGSVRAYKTAIPWDAWAESRLFNTSPDTDRPVSLLVHFPSQPLENDDALIGEVFPHGVDDKKTASGRPEIHIVVKLLPYGPETLTMLVGFEDTLDWPNPPAPLMVDASPDWTVSKLKRRLLDLDGREVPPKSAMLYAVDIPYHPTSSSTPSPGPQHRTARTPLRATHLPLSSFFAPSPSLAHYSVTVYHSSSVIPPRHKYRAAPARFVWPHPGAPARVPTGPGERILRRCESWTTRVVVCPLRKAASAVDLRKKAAAAPPLQQQPKLELLPQLDIPSLTLDPASRSATPTLGKALRTAAQPSSFRPGAVQRERSSSSAEDSDALQTPPDSPLGTPKHAGGARIAEGESILLRPGAEGTDAAVRLAMALASLDEVGSRH